LIVKTRLGSIRVRANGRHPSITGDAVGGDDACADHPSCWRHDNGRERYSNGNASWAALSEERRAVILDGEAAIVNHRRVLEHWIAIGKAFYELQAEAVRQSNSNNPRGRCYRAVYALLELSPEIANLREIDKSDRATTIWLYKNKGAARRWYATLSQSQRDRWTRPQTIKLQYKRMTGASQQGEGEGKPPTKRPSAWDRAKAQIAERDAAIARLQQELEEAEDEMLGRDQAELGRLQRKDAEIARLRKERDAARTRLSAAQNAEIARLTWLSAAQTAEVARLRKERDAARKQLSVLQPRFSALERARPATGPATEAKFRRLERTEVLLRLTELEKATPAISAVHIVMQLRQWLKARAGRDSSEATT
jgi:hypothetical protein